MVPNVTRQPRPFEMARIPPTLPPAEAPQSGILPGEEQVTTMATFGQLTPQEQATLRGRAEGGALPFDEVLSANYGDMNPEERLAAMQRSARSAPRVTIGRDPTLPPGRNSEVAEARQRAGKPLPEGRDMGQYTPEQRAQMTRNVERPEVPMQPFGGTYTRDVSGRTYNRAPDPAKLELADAIAADPEQGPGSPSFVAALADAYGIDARRYGDDLDLLRNDVAVEDRRHQSLMGRFDIQEGPNGAYVYVPNDATQAQGAQAARNAKVRQMASRWWENPDYTREDLAAVEAARQSPEGMNRLRQLQTDVRNRNLFRRGQNVADSRANYNLSQNLNNPNYAPGMAVRSLMREVAAGNPLGMSAAYNIAGNFPASRDAMQAAMNQQNATQRTIEAQMVADAQRAQMEAEQAAAGRTLADMVGPQIEAALQQPPDVALQTVREILSRMQQYEGADPAALDKAAQDMIASQLARSAPNDPRVMAHLRTLATNPQQFLQFVMSHGLAASQDEAMAMLNGYKRTPEQMGADIAAGAMALPQAIGGFVRGIAGGGMGPQARGGAPSP